ncbi:MAG: 4-hydroxy-tetrahydrodipicolinate reductase [Bradymonadales bacterium]|jgi:4-hydroxy-tetrahydrodipicolinate reductase
MSIRIALIGANGRMGRSITELCEQSQDFSIVAKIDNFGAGMLADLSKAPDFDVVVDFSTPDAAMRNIPIAAEQKSAYLLATTGISEDALSSHKAHKNLALLIASNTSIGVALMQALCAQVTASLPHWDCEIQETHHRNKVDSPSGTALTLAKTIQNAQINPGKLVYDRSAIHEPRRQNEIGMSSLRGGSVAGEHSVFWFGPHERLEIRHVAEDRAIFARGALRAAAWLYKQAPGVYSMNDVLNIH